MKLLNQEIEKMIFRKFTANILLHNVHVYNYYAQSKWWHEFSYKETLALPQIGNCRPVFNLEPRLLAREPHTLSPLFQKLKNFILRGFEIENKNFIPFNITLTLAVQNFILNTRRFCQKSPPPLPLPTQLYSILSQ